MPYTSAQVGGEEIFELHGNSPQYELRERVSIVSGSASAQITRLLPPGCRVIWSNIRNLSAVSVAGTSTDATNVNTATRWAIIGQTASSVATATSTVSSPLIGTANGTSSGDLAQGLAQTTDFRNTNTVPMFLFVVPIGNTNSGPLFQAATNANGYKFYSTATNATSGSVAVSLRIQRFDPVPNV